MVAIQGDPEARLEVIAEVPLERADGTLRLGVGAPGELIMRKEFGIRGKEPSSTVSIQDPMAPTAGIAKLGFEGPAVGSVINEFGGIVLTRGRYQLEADTKNGLLPPFAELLNGHRWTSYEVDRKPKCVVAT